jgi:pSer/pThr/pTyr-binding forkhead associated (FHA) protein
MKLRLVVVGGVHEGKPIPITTPQFVIGRDPQCQLRPASPAISKRHCAVLVRGAQVFVRDFGSTNGTFVNDEVVQGEAELHNGDRLKVGPLDFKVELELTKAPARPAAQPAAASAAAKPAAPAASTAKPVAADEAVEVGGKAAPTNGPGSDKFADMLLDDDGSGPAAPTLDNAEVPDGSTVMEVPVNKPGGAQSQKPKAVLGTGNTSQAADEILKKYYRRPRN